MEEKPKFIIKELSIDDRPREKFLMKGQKGLTDAELMAVLIGSGNYQENAVELAQRILKDNNNNLDELSRKSVNSLINKYRGIGEAKAISIIAALELGYRLQREEIVERSTIKSSKDVYKYFSYKTNILVEEFSIILLDRAHKIIGDALVSRGGMAATVVDPKVIFVEALERRASAIILCHNHPSGNTKPSGADDNITEKLVESGKMLDINVIDHVIVAADSYYSYADEGRI